MAIGIDILEHKRISNDKERFALRYLSSKELEIYNSFNNDKRKLEFLASRIASKEAIFKVYKKGDGTLDFKDISILNNSDNSPYIEIKEIIKNDLEISISHSENISIAVVIKI